MTAPPDPFASQKELFTRVLFGLSLATGLMALLGIPFLVGDIVRFYTGRYPAGTMRVAALLMTGFGVPGFLFTVLVRRRVTDPLSLLRVLSEASIGLNGFAVLYGLITFAVSLR